MLNIFIILYAFRYLPILPLVLVNGAEGIGTGWSTSIPNHNPLDIVANLRRMLKGEEPEVMSPWYRGFTGEILEVPAARNATGKSFLISGTIQQVHPSPVSGCRPWPIPNKIWLIVL
jgi:DNA topoisomerase II